MTHSMSYSMAIEHHSDNDVTCCKVQVFTYIEPVSIISSLFVQSFNFGHSTWSAKPIGYMSCVWEVALYV